MAERLVGTVSRGIRCPIIREGDNLVSIVVDSVLNAAKAHHFELNDRDVVAITESIVARAQGNYCTVEDIAEDVKTKLNGVDTVGVVFPILSRNRFAICLRGIAKAVKKVVLMLSYPSDEVGNCLFSKENKDSALPTIFKLAYDKGTTLLTEEEFRCAYEESKHSFTGIDYIEYYKNIIKESDAEAEIVFGKYPHLILEKVKDVITCDIHTRKHSKKDLTETGANIVLGLDDIMTSSVNGSGYNETYGLLGSNKASEDKVKLFPRDAQQLVKDIQTVLRVKTGKNIEVMVYGDGCFKDPVGKIWEFADPVVSPFHTDGLNGTPNELKLKYLADDEFKNLSGAKLKTAIEKRIKEKDSDLFGKMSSEGTTPRQITDLLGSLCDLTSGSGDKGTPIVLVQGYFDNYTTE